QPRRPGQRGNRRSRRSADLALVHEGGARGPARERLRGAHRRRFRAHRPGNWAARRPVDARQARAVHRRHRPNRRGAAGWTGQPGWLPPGGGPPRRSVRRLLLLAVGAMASSSPAPLPSANRLAAQIAERIVGQGAEPPVAIAVRSNSRALTDGFATLLAADLARAKMGPMVLSASADPIQAARAGGARSLVRLGVRGGNGQVGAQGELLGPRATLWAGRGATRAP